MTIRNTPCSCPPGQCAEFVDPPAECINRLRGDVLVAICIVCNSNTWHHNGKCQRCALKAKHVTIDKNPTTCLTCGDISWKCEATLAHGPMCLGCRRIRALREAIRTMNALARDAYPNVNDKAQECYETGERAISDDDAALAQSFPKIPTVEDVCARFRVPSIEGEKS